MVSMRFGVAALFVLTAACSGNPSPASNPNTGPATTARRSDVISAEELADPAVSSGTALDAVRRLRPSFLMTRGAVSIKDPTAGRVQVSIDGGALMTVDNLNALRPHQIAEIRYLGAADAAQRFGTSAGSGAVILVRSK